MRVKIIKRAERDENAAAALTAKDNHVSKSGKRGAKATTAIVESWIDELRRKREDEIRVFKKLFEQ
jgi:hypothetical protein